MAGKIVKATVDTQLLDDGTALLTASAVDGAGLSVPLPAGTPPPVFTSDNPALVVDQSADPSGLTAVVKPATPAAAATGINVSVATTLPNGTAISGAANPIDIVGDPNNVTGFAVATQ